MMPTKYAGSLPRKLRNLGWPKTPPKWSARDSGSPFPGSRYNLAFNGGHAAYSRHTLGSSEMVAPTGAGSGSLQLRSVRPWYRDCGAEIYVVPFHGPRGRWQVSTVGRGSLLGRWARSLFYVTADSRLVGVEYRSKARILKVANHGCFSARSLASSAGLDADPWGASTFGHDGWGTLRLSADPGYELDRVVEALIEFKRKRNGPHVFQHAGRRCTDWD